MAHVSPGREREAGPVAVPAVVGIGASAGGLSALKRLLAHIPDDSGLAFVVVVHLDPERKSHLANLLQAEARLPVRQISGDVALEANTIYVIPPNRNLTAIDTHLRLTDLESERRDRAPIDHFFRTMADTYDGHSIGVVLTGTGSDGALGLRKIKEHGGLTVVQDPNEAEFDGMPQSAIATGVVDLILPLAEIPGKVIRFARTRPDVATVEDPRTLDDEQSASLRSIFDQVRTRTNRDFSRYKRTTIMRRIARRMQIHHLYQLRDYARLMRENPAETQALADEFLITVTEFFRDPEVYDFLRKNIVPGLFEAKDSSDRLRVWTVGCSTGEEAYSLAILLLEEAARHSSPPQIQVFASDLHEHSLRKAREGRYPETIESTVSAERLQRYFVRESGGYRVASTVRELVVFTPHNLLADPPFSRLDLVSCRNVLIYLQRDIQKDVIDLFHYALNSDGHLLLGTAETLDSGESFVAESKEIAVYRRRNVPSKEPRLPVFPLGFTARAPESTSRNEPDPASFGSMHLDLIEKVAPPSLLLSPKDEVLHLSQQAGRYLQPPGGPPTASVMKLIRPELRIELRAALRTSREREEPVRSKPVPLSLPHGERQVVVEVRTASGGDSNDLALVMFDEQQLKGETSEASDQESDASVRELEAELQLTKQQLQAVIEEHETSQEETRASNEELQSMNEELRSTLEELETSKEELQSINEELVTVNQENRHKVDELSQLSSDLQSLMSATQIATLFLDRDLRILRFTPPVADLFNIRTSDQGRPLADLTHRLGYDRIIADAQKVLKNLTPIKREVSSDEGSWYLTRLLPYRSQDDRIDGIVITFVDVTELKRAEEALRRSEERFRALVDASAQTVWSTDAEGAMNEDSPSWRTLTGQSLDEWLGWGWLKGVHEDDRERVEREWLEAVRGARPYETEMRLEVAGSGWRWISLRAVPLADSDGSVRGWVGMNVDVHERRQAEEEVRKRNTELENLVARRTEQLRRANRELES